MRRKTRNNANLPYKSHQIRHILTVLAIILFTLGSSFNTFAQQNEQIRAENISVFKGLDTKTSSQDLTKEYADICENVRFTTPGSIVKRLTRARYNSAELDNSSGFTYLERVYINDSKYTMAAHGAHLMVGHDLTGVFENLYYGVTAGYRWLGATYKNFHYLVNGKDPNLRTVGTEEGTRPMGCPKPAHGCTIVLGDGTGLTGAYSYKITYRYDGYQESNGSPASNSVTPANQDIDLVNIPTTSNADRKIYRTAAGGAIYKYVTTLNSGDTTYTDSLADASLGDTIPSDHGEPPIFKFIKLHDERLFGVKADDSIVYYSDISGVTSYPDIFPDSNYFPISTDDGDVITGMAQDPMGYLCIFKHNSIRKLYTQGSPSQWTVSDVYDIHGCIAPYTIAESPHGIIYLSRSGEGSKEIRAFTGEKSVIISEKIEPLLNSIPTPYITNATGVYDKNRYYFSFNDPSLSYVTYNNSVLIYDFLTATWSKDTGKNINCFSRFYGSDDQGELYTASSNEGYVIREDTDSFDLIHNLKSQFDEGTFYRTYSTGTETAPEVYLVQADILGDFGITPWEDLDTLTWADYSGVDDTFWPSGTLTSTYLEVNAKNLGNLYWTESLGANGQILFYIRTGETLAEIAAASWSDAYSTSTGSDLSGLTAYKYMQYKIRLLTNTETVTVTPKLYVANGYAIKANLGLGTPIENSWAINYRTGDLHFGTPFLRKHFRQLRMKHDGTEGTLYVYYRFDENSESSFSIDLASYPNEWKSNFPYDAFGSTARFRFYYDDDAEIEIKEATVILVDEPLDW